MLCMCASLIWKVGYLSRTLFALTADPHMQVVYISALLCAEFYSNHSISSATPAFVGGPTTRVLVRVSLQMHCYAPNCELYRLRATS